VRPRLHHADRAALREEQRSEEGGGGPERRRPAAPWAAHFDDPAGGVSGPEGLPWAGVWARLHRTPAPRAHRFLAWRVLHAALPCAAWVESRGRSGAGAAAGGRAARARCLHEACAAAGCPETITHIFMHCPVAQQVTGWAGRLWEAVTQQPPPPRTVHVWLAADRAAWRPGEHAELWHMLRVSVLYFLWTARCTGRGEGRALPALAVVAQVVRHMRARMREDAVRAFSRVEDYGVMGGEWLPHRPPLSPSAFRRRWAYRGILCAVDDRAAGPRDVRVRMTLVHPVQPPR
jgi:hypothetical protein